MKIRSSVLNTAQGCIAEAYYRYHLGLVPKQGKQNKDLFFGKAVHKGAEIAIHSSVEDAVTYLEGLLWPATNGKKKKANAIVLVRAFSRWFNYSLIDTEVSHEMRIGRHSWFGRYDVVARDSGVVILDNKTSNPSYLIIRPNSQFTGYYIAAQQHYADFERMEIVGLDPDMLELSVYPFKLSKDAQNEWLKETEHFLNFLEDCFEKEVLPRSDSHCVRYGGRLCPYHEICTSAEYLRERIINHCYEVDREQKNLDW